MLKITRILFYISLLFFPFGNVLRVSLYPGININALDCVVGLLMLVSIPEWYRFARFEKPDLWYAVRNFFIVAAFSLALHSFQLGPLNTLIASFYMIRLAAYLNMVLVLSQLTHEDKSTLASTSLIAGLVFVAFGLTQYALYPNLRNLYYLGWDEHLHRLFGTVFDPNYAGAIIMIVFAQLFIRIRRDVLIKSKLLLSATIISFVSLLLTYSRSSFLGFFAGMGAYALSLRSRVVALIGVIIMVLGIVALPTDLGGEGVNLFRTASGESRIEEYDQAVRIWLGNPIVGVGFNAYRYAQLREGFIELENWQSNHAGAGVPNMYLFVLATTGVLGFFFFCRILWLTAVYAYKSKSYVLFALFIGLCVHGVFENTLFYPHVLYLTVMTLGTQVGLRAKS